MVSDIDSFLHWLKSGPLAQSIVRWQVVPPREPHYALWPAQLDSRIRQALQHHGIDQLYTHQAEAIEQVARGNNVVVITPTASGKSLCYHLPVLQRLLERPEARALYLFPTKALAQDQLAELRSLSVSLNPPVRAFTFDGDTSSAARAAVRRSGQIVITNPDMLHAALLPHHTSWMGFFEQLEFVVVDEIHTYRGVFGSHVALVLRRLQRLCSFYGSAPRFICSSATIANPRDHAERLIGKPVMVVDNDGSLRGAKHFILYNPPLRSPELGIRASPLQEAVRLTEELLRHDVQTILFTRSRLSVELLLTYLRRTLCIAPDEALSPVRGYRGGYLPSERRAIESGLRSGTVRAVVSTNALELGIDIGQLQAAVLVGYPGSISSTWQQTGRAGRTRETSLAIFIAGSSPLDQFIVQHPEFLFGGGTESVTINPTNPLILNAHVKCSAFELPFRDGEQLSTIDVQSLLRELESALLLHHADRFWHWASEKFPATEVNLRANEIENVVIIDRSDATRVIGEMDYLSALTMLYEGAIYLHEGRQFHVDQFAIDEHKVYVRPTEVDYYTDAEVDTDLSIIDVIESRAQGLWRESLGEIAITVRPSIYKKIRLETHENVGWGPIHLPAFDLHTTATWLTFPEGIRQHFPLTLLNSGLLGLATLLQQLAPIFALCDPRDLRAQPESRSKLTGQPVLYLYDTIPAGVGLAPHLYSHWSPLLHAAQAIIEECSCLAGCPSCVGPGNIQGNRKQAARQLLHYLLEDRKVGEFPDVTPSAPAH